MSEYWAKSCQRKRRYDSERKAQEAAKATGRKGPLPVVSYACRFCKGWHVGSVNITKTVARRAS